MLGQNTISSVNSKFSKLLKHDIELSLISIYRPIENITNIGNILVQQELIFYDTVLKQLFHKNWQRELCFYYFYDDDYYKS